MEHQHTYASLIQRFTHQFITSDYLQTGSTIQQTVWAAIQSLGLMENLQQYSPTLAGTFPLGIEIFGSDLDILCEVYESEFFEQNLIEHYGAFQGFSVRRTIKQDCQSMVCSWYAAGFQWEIFAQPKPIIEQQAFRHLVVEAVLLEYGGGQAYKSIRGLKQVGYKTEPAFARYFDLQGDPYTTLFELYEAGDDEVLHLMNNVSQ